MAQLAIITNPHARQNSKDPGRRERFEQMLGNRGVVFETQRLDELTQTCREVMQHDIDLIGICGGDGTNHLVLTALVETYRAAGRELPPVSFLRGGSMNTVGWNLGVRIAAEKALTRLMEKRDAGTPIDTTAVNLLCVNDRYGFIFGNGYAVNFLEEYYGANSTTGPRRAAEIAYKAIASVLSRGDMAKRLARKFSAEVTVDGDALPIRTFGMIIAGFVEYVGIGFKVLYRAREEAGRYHLVATALSPGGITAQIHRFYSGKPLLGAHHFDLLAHETVIRAAAPLAYQLDGEIYRDNEIRLSAGPAVRVAVD